MQITRLFEIVYLLLDRRQMTAAALAAHFEVSPRTIYRDIETLCQAGIPVCTEKGRGGGVSLPERFILNKSVLSEQEQTQILSALRGLEATKFPDAGDVYSKLNLLFGAKHTDWIEVDFSDWNPSRKQTFLQIRDAILERKRLRFTYYSVAGEKSVRTVEPLKLYFKDKAWYLFAFCQTKQELRMFKVTRIKAVELPGETFVRALPEIDTESGETNAGEGPQVRLKLRIEASQAYRVYDEYEEEEIAVEPDGSFLVTPVYIESDWIIGHILSYGDQARLLEPQHLREQVRKRAANIAALYEK